MIILWNLIVARESFEGDATAQAWIEQIPREYKRTCWTVASSLANHRCFCPLACTQMIKVTFLHDPECVGRMEHWYVECAWLVVSTLHKSDTLRPCAWYGAGCERNQTPLVCGDIIAIYAKNTVSSIIESTIHIYRVIDNTKLMSCTRYKHASSFDCLLGRQIHTIKVWNFTPVLIFSTAILSASW